MAPISETLFRRLSFDEDAVEHLQVRDRAELGGSRDEAAVGALRPDVLEDDDPALAARLGRHHRHLGARDELPRVRGVLGAGRNADRETHLAHGAELRPGDFSWTRSARRNASCRRLAGR